MKNNLIKISLKDLQIYMNSVMETVAMLFCYYEMVLIYMNK